MELTTAIQLLQNGANSTKPEQWADLGAGEGLFSRALSKLLYPGSTILAVDKKEASMSFLKSAKNEVEIQKLVADFQEMELRNNVFDGIVMANSLHFLKDKTTMLVKIQGALKPGGKLILIEYDMDVANRWVPYPISFTSLNLLLSKIGLHKAIQLGETASVYQRANIYSAMIKF